MPWGSPAWLAFVVAACAATAVVVGWGDVRRQEHLAAAPPQVSAPSLGHIQTNYRVSKAAGIPPGGTHAAQRRPCLLSGRPPASLFPSSLLPSSLCSFSLQGIFVPRFPGLKFLFEISQEGFSVPGQFPSERGSG